MAKYTITIDGGTTNTRVYLLDENDRILFNEKSEVGVRNTAIDGNNSRLKEAISKMIQSAASTVKDRDFFEHVTIVASGMLTSNVGLYELPHITAPATTADFAKGVKTVLMEDVCKVPIAFIPGLKNYRDDQVTLQNIRNMDMMRGEEVETIALLDSMDSEEGMMLILPGSHTKMVAVGAHQEILGCLTCMTGEMLQMLTQNSILADAVDGFLEGKPDMEYLKAGYLASKQSGSLCRSGFLTRICSTFLTKDKEELRSFLLGAVLEQDITAIENSHMMSELSPNSIHVKIAGKEPLASSIGYLMNEFSVLCNIEILKENHEMPMSVKGALSVLKLMNQNI